MQSNNPAPSVPKESCLELEHILWRLFSHLNYSDGVASSH